MTFVLLSSDSFASREHGNHPLSQVSPPDFVPSIYCLLRGLGLQLAARDKAHSALRHVVFV